MPSNMSLENVEDSGAEKKIESEESFTKILVGEQKIDPEENVTEISGGEIGIESKESETANLKPCPTCSRKFTEKALERHRNICGQFVKRTPFNSFSQRVRDLSAILPKLDPEIKNKDSQNKKKTKNTSPGGLISCPSCGRSFNEKAADRHIPICEEKQKILAKSQNNTEALNKLKARVKYQPPVPKRRSSLESSRLVKSAETFQKSVTLTNPTKHSSEPKVLKKSSSMSMRKHVLDTTTNNNNTIQTEESKKVHFNGNGPVCTPFRNQNINGVDLLRRRFSATSLSDDFSEDYFFGQDSTPESPSDSSLLCRSCTDDESNEVQLPAYCYNCGKKYPVSYANFCCMCGHPRFVGQSDVVN